MPDPAYIRSIEEPFIEATILTTDEFVGPILALAIDRRGQQKKLEYVSTNRVMIVYEMPLNEVILDFFDKLKSISRGYASLDYQFVGYRESDLVKMDILVNGEPLDALSLIVHKDKAYARGKLLVEKMKEFIPRQMFEVALQAAIGNRVIARETVKAMRKDVLAKCYGGDISRKRKLLEKQKEGKKRMKRVGKVEIPQEAFLGSVEDRLRPPPHRRCSVKSSGRSQSQWQFSFSSVPQLRAARVDIKDPRRALGREDDIRVDAQMLAGDALRRLSDQRHLPGRESDSIADRHRRQGRATRLRRRFADDHLSIGAEIPHGTAMPHLVHDRAGAEALIPRPAPSPQILIANAQRARWRACRASCRSSSTFCAISKPFANLIAQQAKSAAAPPLPNDLFDHMGGQRFVGRAERPCPSAGATNEAGSDRGDVASGIAEPARRRGSANVQAI